MGTALGGRAPEGRLLGLIPAGAAAPALEPCPGPEPLAKACAPQPGPATLRRLRPAELAMTWAAGLLWDELAVEAVVAGSLLTRVPCFTEDSWDLAATGVAGALCEELPVGKVPAGNTLTRITSTEDFWDADVDVDVAVTGVARALSEELAVDGVAAGSGLTPVTFTGGCWERLGGLGAGARDGDLRKLLASHGVKLFPDQLFPELQGSLMRRGGCLTPFPWTEGRTDTISGCSGSFPGGSPLRLAELLELWDEVTGHLAFCGTATSGRMTTPPASVFDSGGTPSEWSSVEGCGGDICSSHPASFQGLLGPERGGLFSGCTKVSSVV